MKKNTQIFCAVSLIFLGWIFNAIAWTATAPYISNTFFLVSGVLGFIVGVVWVILILFLK